MRARRAGLGVDEDDEGRPALGRATELATANLDAVTRRQQILDIAAELFAQKGFHGVSIAELGAACGFSGPALYRHFRSKDAVLAEMLVSISDELLTVGRERVRAAESPD